MKRLTYFLSVLFFLIIGGATSNPEWKNLIKNNLRNWKQYNGNARYELKYGVIIGTAVLNSPNSFLCSRSNYGDFILEYDFWVDPDLNSGVQLRSESRANYQNGRVYGYQVEIDPSSRAWTGGIYDEGRRGWLYTLERNPAGKKAFKNKDWNHIRVEAIGKSIRTWLNGIPCADLIDDVTPKGFIGFQMHSIGQDSSKAGKKVMWKNIRIITKNPEIYATAYTSEIEQISYLNNSLTEREIKEGWELLWDGKTSAGWRSCKTTNFPSEDWEIKDGTLTVVPSVDKAKSGEDIITINKYRNFELIVDFLYTHGANSGIKYFVDAETNKGALARIGCEYQILDDKQNPDARLGIDGNHTMAGLYDLIPPKDKIDNGPNQWNRAMIIVKGSHIEHWLNGKMTLSCERDNAVWKALVAASKFRDSPGFGEASEGHILLQDHGDKVSFRNIKIREL